jgi:hypothetical protein
METEHIKIPLRQISAANSIFVFLLMVFLTLKIEQQTEVFAICCYFL